jgi:hypothetical protein
LESAVANLQSANSALQGQVSGLQNRVSVLELNNAALQNKITTLQNQLAGVQNQQNALGDTIMGLQNENQVYVGRPSVSPVTELAAGVFAPVASVWVPPGNYLIHATVPVENLDSGDQSGECFLSTTGHTQNSKEGLSPKSAGDALYRISGFGTLPLPSIIYWNVQFPLLDVASFPSPATITVFCAGYRWTVQPTVVAISIGGIH